MPVGLCKAFRRCTFPQNRITDGADAQPGKVFQVIKPVMMPVQQELIIEMISYPVDSTFYTCPYLNWRIIVISSHSFLLLIVQPVYAEIIYYTLPMLVLPPG